MRLTKPRTSQTDPGVAHPEDAAPEITIFLGEIGDMPTETQIAFCGSFKNANSSESGTPKASLGR